MSVPGILKAAFVVSVLIYGVIALLVVGAPDGSKPVLPEEPGAAAVVGALALLALAGWGAGTVVGRTSDPRSDPAAAPQAQLIPIRFILAIALLESGAVFGLVLSFLYKDSRFALAAAVISAILIAMTPTPASPER